jgi:hypothetical protein
MIRQGSEGVAAALLVESNRGMLAGARLFVERSWAKAGRAQTRSVNAKRQVRAMREPS